MIFGTDQRFALNENQIEALQKEGITEDLIKDEAKRIILEQEEVLDENFDFFISLSRKYIQNSKTHTDEKLQSVGNTESSETLYNKNSDLLTIEEKMDVICKVNLRKIFLCNKYTGGDINTCSEDCPLYIGGGCSFESQAEFHQMAAAKILLILISKEDRREGVDEIVAEGLRKLNLVAE